MSDLLKQIGSWEAKAQYNLDENINAYAENDERVLILCKALKIAVHDIRVFKHISTDEKTKERSNGCLEDIQRTIGGDL